MNNSDQDIAPGAAPLSFAQERLWLLQRLAPADPSYNLTRAFRLRGALDRNALQSALTALAWRHDLLRSYFPATEDGTPCQKLLDRPAIRLRHERCAGGEDREAALAAVIDAEVIRPFDLTTEPPYRAMLVECPADEAVLLLSMHHMVSDGPSNAVLVRDLLSAYQAACADPLRDAATLLPPASMQYADFARAQRDALRAGHLAQAITSAAGRLERDVEGERGPIAALDMPVDCPRRVDAQSMGDRLDFVLPAQLATEALRLARSEGCTPFIIILAAWAILLARWSGQGDFGIGVPNAGRADEAFEDVVGFFVETEVYRVRLRPGMSARHLIAALRADARAMLDDGPVPFDRLLEQLPATERDDGRTPLFQTLVNVQMDTAATLRLPGLAVEAILVAEHSAKFDLTLDIAYSSAGVRCSIEYAAHLFDRETIAAIAAHFETLLAAIAADPARPWDQFNLWTEVGRRAALACGTGPTAAIGPAHDMIVRFESMAARQPDAMAAICGDETISYAVLNARANRLARALRRQGVGAETLVGVALPRGIDMLVALLAIGKAGGAYLPLDPAQPQARTDLIRERAKPLLVIDGPVDDLLAAEPDAPAPEAMAAPHPRQLAYILYTSGSTGVPKGVGIDRRALANFLEAMRPLAPMGPGDRLLAVTTLGFDIAGLELFLPLVSGATVVIAPQEAVGDPLALAGLIQRHDVTVMQATPAGWRLLADGTDARWPGLRALCGGEALGTWLAQRLLDRGVDLVNVYGPTETTIWSSALRLEGRAGDGSTVPLGHPIANTRLHILDAHMEPVPAGAIGELWIGGDGLARGYAGAPGLTAAAFVPDPFAGPGAGARLYRTGDRVRRRSDGTIEFLGRRDHQLKIRGFRVEPAEIEAVLERHPAISQAVVVARADSDGDVTLAAYLLLAAGQTVAQADLSAHVSAYLPCYMVPADWAVLDSLPLNASGKVDRAALPDVVSDATAQPGGVGPAGETEARLLTLWSDVLDRSGFGVTDNFFGLGGHSLRLARLQTRIRAAFGHELPLPELFRAPTVRQMAALIDARQPVDAAGDLAFMTNLLETL